MSIVNPVWTGKGGSRSRLAVEERGGGDRGVDSTEVGMWSKVTRALIDKIDTKLYDTFSFDSLTL
jgi:hypothetical protein